MFGTLIVIRIFIITFIIVPGVPATANIIKDNIQKYFKYVAKYNSRFMLGNTQPIFAFGSVQNITILKNVHDIVSSRH